MIKNLVLAGILTFGLVTSVTAQIAPDPPEPADPAGTTTTTAMDPRNTPGARTGPFLKRRPADNCYTGPEGKAAFLSDPDAADRALKALAKEDSAKFGQMSVGEYVNRVGASVTMSRSAIEAKHGRIEKWPIYGISGTSYELDPGPDDQYWYNEELGAVLGRACCGNPTGVVLPPAAKVECPPPPPECPKPNRELKCVTIGHVHEAPIDVPLGVSQAEGMAWTLKHLCEHLLVEEHARFEGSVRPPDCTSHPERGRQGFNHGPDGEKLSPNEAWARALKHFERKETGHLREKRGELVPNV